MIPRVLRFSSSGNSTARRCWPDFGRVWMGPARGRNARREFRPPRECGSFKRETSKPASMQRDHEGVSHQAQAGRREKAQASAAKLHSLAEVWDSGLHVGRHLQLRLAAAPLALLLDPSAASRRASRVTSSTALVFGRTASCGEQETQSATIFAIL